MEGAPQSTGSSTGPPNGRGNGDCSTYYGCVWLYVAAAVTVFGLVAFAKIEIVDKNHVSMNMVHRFLEYFYTLPPFLLTETFPISPSHRSTNLMCSIRAKMKILVFALKDTHNPLSQARNVNTIFRVNVLQYVCLK